jgi:hypothetical protein
MEDDRPAYFDDDGSESNPDLLPKPSVCVSCKKDEMGGEQEMFCNLNRADQQGEETFCCEAYEPKE